MVLIEWLAPTPQHSPPLLTLSPIDEPIMNTDHVAPHLRRARLPNMLAVLRVTIALMFMAHALVRLVGGSVERFAAFLDAKGFPFALTLVLLISSYELIAGFAIALDRGVRWLAPGLIFIAAMGIVLIHAGNGWFVGEHGSGGMEYSICLIAALLVLIAHDRDRMRLQ